MIQNMIELMNIVLFCLVILHELKCLSINDLNLSHLIKTIIELAAYQTKYLKTTKSMTLFTIDDKTDYSLFEILLL